MQSVEQDLRFMRRALSLAEVAADKGETPVGAVLVDESTGQIIAEAHNEPISGHDPSGHAELLAIRRGAQILQNYRLKRNLTLYVTLEPCTMCAGAISHARVTRLVYGASDPKGGAVESGVKFFDQPTCHHRPQVTSGILAEDAAGLLKAFFKARRVKTA